MLAHSATTSAGIYNPQGQLVRTLWRAEPLVAGEHRGSWDERDDTGRQVAQGEHEIKVLHHRLNYVWEGVVGNSAGTFTGGQVFRSRQPPNSIVIDGARAYYAVGYNEGQPGIHAFDLAEPQFARSSPPSTDPFVSYAMVATDAARLYWANSGGLSRTSFVGAIDLKAARVAGFAAGQAVCLNRHPTSKECYKDQTYASVIDVETQADRIPTGLAVQPNGRVLAVAHGAINLVRLFDKTSGELLREITVPLIARGLNQLAMSPTGDLWVISRESVLRYSGLDGQPRIAQTISGLQRPLALATHPGDEGSVWIAEGGTRQQVTLYDRYGQASVAVGTPGGYSTEPGVSADKLCFRAADGGEQTAIAVASDHSMWVVDYCNNRMLRFRGDAQGRKNGDVQIAYLPHSYTATVDHGNPRRVFANFLEFEVESGVPLQPGRSWKLVRNWLAGLPSALADPNAINSGFGGFNSVKTFSNGRTFGLLQAQGRQTLVELPPAGPLRVVKTFAKPAPGSTANVLYENGDLGYALTGPSTQTAMRLLLTGFDSLGDPVWSVQPLRLATVPKLRGSPYYRDAFSGLPPRFPVTQSGRVVFFDQSVEGNEGFHLGASVVGENGWLWQASPSAPLDGKGSFQTKAIDGTINYGGNSVWAVGRHIVYGYHGEFYKDLPTGRVGQANQFMHFDESGLFLGQFGLIPTRATLPSQAGLSGNAFSPTLVRDGRHLYLYHNDEWAHAGVHRWRIDGWDAIGELRGTGHTGSTIALQ